VFSFSFIHFFKCFRFLLYIYFFNSKRSYLMGNGNHRRLLGLDVVLVEVALEVEVGQRLSLRGSEELLEGHVRLEVVLVLEALLRDVGRHRLGDIGAGHLRTLGLGQEGAEIIAEASRDLEDGEAGRLGHTILIKNRRRAALALAGILDLASHTLLELLQLAVEARDGLAHGGEGRHHGADLITHGLGRGLNHGISGRRSGRARCNDDRGSHNRSDLSGLRGLLGHLLDLGNSHSHGGRGGNRDRHNGLISLLGNTLDSSLGNGGRSIHCTRSGGSIRRHFTHYLPLMTVGQSNFSSSPCDFLGSIPFFCFFFEEL